MIINPEKEPIKQYISTLNESQFRSIVAHFLERRCGYAQIWHSSAEHGVDIAALYHGDRDFVNQAITVLVQVKMGRIGLTEIRTNIFGQMSEVFVRTIKSNPFHEFNPRRLLLIVGGTLTQEARNFVDNWNNKISLPIEVYDIDRMADFLYSEYASLNNIKKIVGGSPIVDSDVREELQIQGSEDIVALS